MLYQDAVKRTLRVLNAQQRQLPTLAAYRCDLRLYGGFIATACGRHLEELTLRDCADVGVERYLDYLRDERANAPATVARRLAAVRALYRVCWRPAHLKQDPAQQVAYPDGPRRTVRALALPAVRALVRAAAVKSRAPLRDALMLLL